MAKSTGISSAEKSQDDHMTDWASDCFSTTFSSVVNIKDSSTGEIVEQKSSDSEVSNKDDVSKDSSDWSVNAALYVSEQYAYGGYGTGPPAGPRVYKSDKELKDIKPPEASFLAGESWFMTFYSLIRLVITMVVGTGAVVALAIAYGYDLTLLQDPDARFAFGPYGALLVSYTTLQYIFAYLSHRQARKSVPPEDFHETSQHTIAIQISAHQEDPDYFRECLRGVMRLKYPQNNIKVLCCIDGNGPDSLYMAEIFHDVMNEFGKEGAFFRWDYNFHELPQGLSDSENGVASLMECVERNQFILIMQKWGGKREVMYTAFKALKDKVDFVQVCDSDTQLDPMATAELAWVLEAQPHTGAVGGDVQIWNDGDSFVSFLSSLRYWVAFNVERASQSYFGVVSCISGPIGLYRMSLVSQIVDLWSDQKFLGDVCTFGDDRHLTNRILQLGYATRYTPRSFCRTETPSGYLRWLSQQIRWTKSYYREWLFNSLWWHKHNLWMTIDSVFAGTFPFFIMYTILILTWSGSLWALLSILIVIQLVGLFKGFLASLVRRNSLMLFLSLYSCLYITSLLPAKPFAILTMRKKSWGTSGRKNVLTTYNALIPVSVWFAAVVGGLIYTCVVNDYAKAREVVYLSSAAAVYALYWIVMLVVWKIRVQRHQLTLSDIKSQSSQSLGIKLPGEGSGRLSDTGDTARLTMDISIMTNGGFSSEGRRMGSTGTLSVSFEDDSVGTSDSSTNQPLAASTRGWEEGGGKSSLKDGSLSSEEGSVERSPSSKSAPKSSIPQEESVTAGDSDASAETAAGNVDNNSDMIQYHMMCLDPDDDEEEEEEEGEEEEVVFVLDEEDAAGDDSSAAT